MSTDGLGTFRQVERGDHKISVNSKAMNQDRFIDQSRLSKRYGEEYVPSDTPGKYGEWVPKVETASPADNARLSCDAMKHKSSFVDESVPANENGNSGCCPSPCYYGGDGPMTRRHRGDDND